MNFYENYKYSKKIKKTTDNNSTAYNLNSNLKLRPELRFSLIFLIFPFIVIFLLLLNPALALNSDHNSNGAARILENSDSNAKIIDSNQSAHLQTDDFVFLLKTENGGFEPAGINNIKDPALLEGVKAAANHLNDNLEFKSMLNFYKKSHTINSEKRKNELNDKIKNTQELLAKKEISKREAEADIKLYNHELKNIENIIPPPLAIIIGTNPAEKTSYMLASPFEFKLPADDSSSDSASKIIKSPGYIMLQYEEITAIANEKTRSDGLSVLAHETGHAISNNTTGLRNITIDYKDPNPLFLVDENIKNDTDVIEFIKKGDPVPSSHWHEKVLNSQTAFEEGFAEFTAAFFISPTHNGNNIADDDFLTGKIGYRIKKGTDEISAVLEWSDEVKNTGELLNTEFFISKILYRIAMSYDDPYTAYNDIMTIKSSAEFKESPDLNRLIKLFASSRPAEFKKFTNNLTAEFTEIASKNQRRIQTEERKLTSELLKQTGSIIIKIGAPENESNLITDAKGNNDINDSISATSEEVNIKNISIKKPDDKNSNGTAGGAAIKIMSEKIDAGSINDN